MRVGSRIFLSRENLDPLQTGQASIDMEIDYPTRRRDSRPFTVKQVPLVLRLKRADHRVRQRSPCRVVVRPRPWTLPSSTLLQQGKLARPSCGELRFVLGPSQRVVIFEHAGKPALWIWFLISRYTWLIRNGKFYCNGLCYCNW